MKLDSRIMKGKKPLDCFDVDIARQFIGKKGYFGTCSSQFMDLDTFPKCIVDELKEIDNYDNYPFMTAGGCCYCYFLPVEWVNLEKKYRPYSIAEFLKLYPVGDIVEFRDKKCDEFYRVMFIGYITNSNRSMDEKPGETDVMLGNYLYSLSHLFEDYELFFETKWQPFGMEDKE